MKNIFFVISILSIHLTSCISFQDFPMEEHFDALRLIDIPITFENHETPMASEISTNIGDHVFDFIELQDRNIVMEAFDSLFKNFNDTITQRLNFSKIRTKVDSSFTHKAQLFFKIPLKNPQKLSLSYLQIKIEPYCLRSSAEPFDSYLTTDSSIVVTKDKGFNLRLFCFSYQQHSKVTESHYSTYIQETYDYKMGYAVSMSLQQHNEDWRPQYRVITPICAKAKFKASDMWDYTKENM